MLKKIIIGIAVLGVVLLAGWKIFYNPQESIDKFSTIAQNLNAYHMEATMEITENDEKKNYYVTVDYKKDGEDDYFRISLLDRDIKQEQILLRNKEGVFVLTPLLNQVYKFKGDYPLNSPKPYLYHSMLEAIGGEHELKSMSDGYLLSYTPKYDHQQKWVKEDIKFSSDLKPVWVNIYDKDSSLVATILFAKVDLTPTFSDDFFSVEANMQKARENLVDSSSKLEDLPFLPASMNLDATLKEQTEATANGETIFILTYEGSKNYKVIQKLISPSEQLEQIDNPGEYVDTIYGIGFTRNKYFTYITGNVSYEVFSSDLEVNEMVDIVTNMEVSQAK